MAENNKGGLGILGLVAVVAVLGIVNFAFFAILYQGLVSSGMLDFLIPPVSNWEQIQTQVNATLPAGGTSTPQYLAHAALSLRATPTSTPFRPPSVTPPPTPLPTLPPASPGVAGASGAASRMMKIQGITAHKPSMPLTNEARVAVDWAAFFGVTIDEMTFQKSMPVTDDPEVGFAGDVEGELGEIPPKGYGAHAQPVAIALQKHGVKARARKNMTMDQLLAQIGENKPVIAWVKGSMEGGSSVVYTTGGGKLVAVTPNAHAVIVFGYDLGANPPTVTVLNRGNEEVYPMNTFLNSWLVLGNMAVSAPG